MNEKERDGWKDGGGDNAMTKRLLPAENRAPISINHETQVTKNDSGQQKQRINESKKESKQHKRRKQTKKTTKRKNRR